VNQTEKHWFMVRFNYYLKNWFGFGLVQSNHFENGLVWFWFWFGKISLVQWFWFGSNEPVSFSAMYTSRVCCINTWAEYDR
jgi:hypothetical protein